MANGPSADQNSPAALIEDALKTQSYFVYEASHQYIAKYEVNGDSHLYVIDPWTWGWVAVTLAEGVISYIGASIFKSFLGLPSAENMVEKAVAELKEFVRNELEYQIVKECEELNYSCFNLLNEYKNAPEVSRYKIQEADVTSRKLVDRLDLRLPSSIGPYINSISIRLAVLYALWETDKHNGQIVNLVSEYKTAHGKAKYWSDKFDADTRQSLESIGNEIKYFGSETRRVDGGIDPTDRPHITHTYGIMVDGSWHFESHRSKSVAREMVEGFRANIVEQRQLNRELTMTKLVGPIRSTLDSWTKAMQRFL